MTAIQIFKAGTHTSMDGDTIPFSEGDLDGMASVYDPSLHEAPLVIGHPQTNSPAYGWVKSVTRDGQSLRAEPHQVDERFAELVRKGHYKKVSASFYRPDSPANPAPGTYYLRHVGFLGAQPPAVKGLAPVELSEGGSDTLTVELSEASAGQGRGALASFADWLRQNFGQPAADHVLSPRGGQRHTTSKERAMPPSASYAETQLGKRLEELRDEKELTNADLAEAMGIDESTVGQILNGSIERPPNKRLKGAAELLGVSFEDLWRLVPEGRREDSPPQDVEDLAERERRIAEREAAFAERERQHRHADNEQALARMVEQGIPLPCAKERLLAFMDQLGEAGAVQFSEGESKDPLSFFRDEVLASLPKQVDYGERAGRDGGDVQVDSADSLARAALQYQEEQRKAGVMVSTAEAVAHIQNQQKGA